MSIVSERVPLPAGSAQVHPGPDPEALLGSPLARLVLGRARMRSGLPVDVITFVARCPGCGDDCEWTQSRDDTRVRSSQACACGL